jgi:hypothetical protein
VRELLGEERAQLFEHAENRELGRRATLAERGRERLELVDALLAGVGTARALGLQPVRVEPRRMAFSMSRRCMRLANAAGSIPCPCSRRSNGDIAF